MTASAHPDLVVRDLSNKLLREAGYLPDSTRASEETRSTGRKFISAIVIVGVLLAFFAANAIKAHYTIKNLELEALATSTPIAGTATVSGGKPGWLSIQNQGTILLSCSLRQCGFPGVFDLSGKEIEVRVSGGFVLVVTVNGKSIDAKKLRLESEFGASQLFQYLSAAAAAIFLLLIARYWSHLKRLRGPQPGVPAELRHNAGEAR